MLEVIVETAVAVVPPPTGPATVIVGAVGYPDPASSIDMETTPFPVGSIEHVAAAPVPPPPVI